MPDALALREVVIAAARAFNAGHYFEAHEVLEDGLESVPDEMWSLFVGLIQIAVGYHKATQGQWDGALRMLGLGLEKIQPYAAAAGGLNLEVLRQRVHTDLNHLRNGTFDSAALAAEPPRLQPLA